MGNREQEVHSHGTRSLRPLQMKTNRSGLIRYRYAFRIFREIARNNPWNTPITFAENSDELRP